MDIFAYWERTPEPWSKVKVIVYNTDDYNEVLVAIYLDGRLMKTDTIEANGGGVIGVWNVKPGSHTIGIDGTYSRFVSLDGVADVVDTAMVGPLYTKNVYMYVKMR